MKFFHLSDLHIGKQLHHHNLSDDQREMLEQILQQVRVESPQAVLISGDIYDSAVPSAEAVSLFDDFLTKLNHITPQPAILIIAGNHDNGRRLAYAGRILADSNIYVAGMPPMKPDEYMQKVTLEDEYGPVDFYLLPFAKPSHVRGMGIDQVASYEEAVSFLIRRENIDTSRRNVILSHQFYVQGNRKPEQSDSEMRLVGGLEQVDVSLLAQFDYAALGHIHKPQSIGGAHIRYCGTMFPYSVSEAEDAKSITVVILEKKGTKPTIETIPLSPTHRVRRITGTLLELLEAAGGEIQEDYVSITLTDDIDPYYPRERLMELYPGMLELQMDNARTRKVMDLLEEDVEVLDPGEAFSCFFEEMNGRKMTKAEADKMQEIILECREDEA